MPKVLQHDVRKPGIRAKKDFLRILSSELLTSLDLFTLNDFTLLDDFVLLKT